MKRGLTGHIHLGPAGLSDAGYLSTILRSDDIAECEARRLTPCAALQETLSGSVESIGAYYDGGIFCMFGVGVSTLYSDEACIWMVGSNRIYSLSRELVTVSKNYIRAKLSEYRKLYNFVYSGSARSIGYLRHLDFTFKSEFDQYCEGKRFLYFEKEREE